MLGNAWESVDVFYALHMALRARGDRKPAYFASLRLRELVDQGKGSLAPGAERGQALKDRIRAYAEPVPGFPDRPELDGLYPRLRADAEQYQAARTDYLLPRLQAGQHPDTYPHFWDEWREPPTLSLRLPSDPLATPRIEGLVLGYAAAGLGIAFCLILALAALKRHLAIVRTAYPYKTS